MGGQESKRVIAENRRRGREASRGRTRWAAELPERSRVHVPAAFPFGYAFTFRQHSRWAVLHSSKVFHTSKKFSTTFRKGLDKPRRLWYNGIEPIRKYHPAVIRPRAPRTHFAGFVHRREGGKSWKELETPFRLFSLLAFGSLPSVGTPWGASGGAGGWTMGGVLTGARST